MQPLRSIALDEVRDQGFEFIRTVLIARQR